MVSEETEALNKYFALAHKPVVEAYIKTLGTTKKDKEKQG